MSRPDEIDGQGGEGTKGTWEKLRPLVGDSLTTAFTHLLFMLGSKFTQEKKKQCPMPISVPILFCHCPFFFLNVCVCACVHVCRLKDKAWCQAQLV